MAMGRPKGSTNRKNLELKTMILHALNKAGGQDYLARQAEQNPAAFLTLIGKVLPLQLPEGKGTFRVTWES